MRTGSSVLWLIPSALHSIVYSNLAFFFIHTHATHTLTVLKTSQWPCIDSDLWLPQTLYKNPVMYQHFESAPCVITHRLFVTILTRNTLGLCLPTSSERQRLLTLFLQKRWWIIDCLKGPVFVPAEVVSTLNFTSFTPKKMCSSL